MSIVDPFYKEVVDYLQWKKDKSPADYYEIPTKPQSVIDEMNKTHCKEKRRWDLEPADSDNFLQGVSEFTGKHHKPNIELVSEGEYKEQRNHFWIGAYCGFVVGILTGAVTVVILVK